MGRRREEGSPFDGLEALAAHAGGTKAIKAPGRPGGEP